jgi:hypothetical protein
MQIIPVVAAYDQAVSLIMGAQRVTLRLWYNVTTERWNLDLSRDGAPVLTGKRMPLGTDVLAAHGLGMGALLFHSDKPGAVADYESVVSGAVQLIHVEPEELA